MAKNDKKSAHTHRRGILFLTAPAHSASFFPISERLRSELKEPLGRLIPNPNVTRELLFEHAFRLRDESNIRRTPGSAVGTIIVATVGDRSTERVLELGLVPNLEIVDSREQRADRRDKLDWFGPEESIFVTENPAGGISSSALKDLERCFIHLQSCAENSTPRARLFVSGEEDLLTLPVIAFYPGRAFVLYGQPGVGLVMVDSLDARARCLGFLEDMGIRSIRGG